MRKILRYIGWVLVVLGLILGGLFLLAAFAETVDGTDILLGGILWSMAGYGAWKLKQESKDAKAVALEVDVAAAINSFKSAYAEFFGGEKLQGRMAQFFRFAIIMQKIRLDRMKLSLALTFDPRAIKQKTFKAKLEGRMYYFDVEELLKVHRKYLNTEITVVAELKDTVQGHYDILKSGKINSFCMRQKADVIAGTVELVPKFSTADFFNNVQLKIEVIHFADTMLRLEMFCQCNLQEQLKQYKQVVACDTEQLILTKFSRQITGEVAVIDASLQLFLWDGRALEKKSENVEITLKRIHMDEQHTYNDAEVFKCSNCGEAISLLKGKMCPACSQEVNFSVYDWCITEYVIKS